MLNQLVDRSLAQRLLVLVGALLLVGYGAFSAARLPVAAFPDVTSTQVQINTEAPGLAATDVENLITFPLETALAGLPDATQVRSISKTGLSSVTIVFADGVDIYFARQLVAERVTLARERIPPGLGEPELGPISTGLGQVYAYLLAGEGKTLMELRELNDWLVKPQLRSVPGVAEVLSFGGNVREYQVRADPARLLGYEITLNDLRTAIADNNRNAGGWYLEGPEKQLVVRGEGRLAGGEAGLADIGRIVLRSEDGTPVYVHDVAEVAIGSAIRQGAATLDGKGEVMLGWVLQLQGANTKEVIDRVHRRIEEIGPALPEGVRIVPIYDQSELVNRAVGTVTNALRDSALLILAVLFLFLGSIRAALVVVVSIPLSILAALIAMRWGGLSANLQSLGGLAVAIGMMVDGAVVVVENATRHLEEDGAQSSVRELVRRSAQEVARPVFFAVLIIVVVFLPLFTLQEVEGKLFRPLAFTVAAAMLGALAVALTVVPVLASFALRASRSHRPPLVMRWIEPAYRRALRAALANPRTVVAAAALGLVAAVALLPFLGTEFVPELEEGTLVVRATTRPDISLEQAKAIAGQIERRLLQHHEVTYALSQIGRAELGGEPEPISLNEIFVGLRPRDQWQAHSRAELVEALAADVERVPGVITSFSQPIANRVDELISGTKAQLAIKIFGEDLAVLERKGREVEAAIRGIPGAADVQLEQLSGEEQLVVRAERETLARYGLNAGDVMELVSTAVGGESVGEVIDGQRRFDIYLRLAEAYRASPRAIADLWLAAPGGPRVRLSEVARIERVEAPPTVTHENGQRRAVVLCNVRGRDLGGFVQDAKRLVASRVDLPPGYFVTWGGQFESQQRAQLRLLTVIPVSLGLIFLFLFLSLGAVRPALIILLNVPFALIGGVFGLWLAGEYLSVPSSIGFIALFGVAVLNGVVMVSYFEQLLAGGMPLGEAIANGARLRLRPVLMTATVASLGLAPLLVSQGVGSEVQRPLAVVVVSGLFTSTLLTLLVLPVVYRWAKGQESAA